MSSCCSGHLAYSIILAVTLPYQLDSEIVKVCLFIKLWDIMTWVLGIPLKKGWVLPPFMTDGGLRSCSLLVFLVLKRVAMSGGVAQAIEGLLCECEALSSNPSPTTKKNKRLPV
jgi:hypothetical protein